MKFRIIVSIKLNTPLSDLHNELHLRQDMSIRDLIDWRLENYPSTFKRENEGFKLEISFEISNILT